MPSLRVSYYPWITQHVDGKELDRQIRRFVIVVQAQLKKILGSGYGLEVLPPLEVPEQIAQLVSGGAEIAFMNPLGFVFARQRDPGIETIGVAQREIDGKVGTTYFSQIYVHKKTPITSLGRLIGRSFAFGSKASTSNFLVPAAALAARKLHPLVAFSNLRFLGGHDTVAKAVYDRSVDAGAGHDGAIHDLSTQYGYGDALDVLVAFSGLILSQATRLQCKQRITSFAKPVPMHSLEPAKTRKAQTHWRSSGVVSRGSRALTHRLMTSSIRRLTHSSLVKPTLSGDCRCLMNESKFHQSGLGGTIERKSLPDLLDCIGQDRERFDPEVIPLPTYPVLGDRRSGDLGRDQGRRFRGSPTQ